MVESFQGVNKFDRQATSACRFCLHSIQEKMYRIYRIALVLIAINQAVLAQSDSSSMHKDLQEFVIHGIKATEKQPITFSSLNKKQIEERYYGVDLPGLINSTPSINAYSDNGSGIGYSYFRLRGIDQTRINTTVNGIPVNDPENQGVFFNNFADLATSAESIQIQRGVGTSTNGTSAFGGSINLLTKNLSEKPEVRLSSGLGSYHASRVAAEFQSGLLADHFLFYGRYSEIKTDGFRQHSGAAIQSYTFSGAYLNKRSLIKLNLFGGSAQNQLSYLGIDKVTYDSLYKSNPFTNGETDAFKQHFFQIQYTFQISQNHTLSASAYYVTGNAPKFQFLFPGSWGYTYDYFNMPDAIIGTDTLKVAGDMMTSYRLDQRFWGGFANYNMHTSRLDLTAGFHLNSFVSDHFMEINWGSLIPAGIEQNHQVYFNTGYKKEASIFCKANYSLTEDIGIFGDIQYRSASFSYKGRNLEIRKDPFIVENMKWSFLNPRIGARFMASHRQSLYGMVGFGKREPTRFDYFQDDFATKNTKQDEIKPEEVLDLELGYELNNKIIKGKVNLFAMEFKNQIVGLGQLNGFGYPVTGNVGSSYRRGIEGDVTVNASRWFRLFMSSSISTNKIKELNQHFTSDETGNDTVVVFKNTTLGFTPSAIHNFEIKFIPVSWFNMDLIGRSVSSQFLDNTQNNTIRSQGFKTLDLRMSIYLKPWIKLGEPIIRIQLNNVGDVKYAPTGSLGGPTTNPMDKYGNRGNYSLYLPAAGRNFFITLDWKF